MERARANRKFTAHVTARAFLLAADSYRFELRLDQPHFLTGDTTGLHHVQSLPR